MNRSLGHRAADTFAAATAHDMLNALAAIRGLVAEAPRPDEDVLACVSDLVLLTELLEANAGARGVRSGAVDLSRVTRTTARLLRKLAPEGVAVETDAGQSLPETRTDAPAVAQLLFHAASRLVPPTARGTLLLSLALRGDGDCESTGEVAWTVRFAPDPRAPVASGESAWLPPGLALSDSAAHELARSLGGELRDAELRDGARVCELVLPSGADAASRTLSVDPRAPADPAAEEPGLVKVLLVDDHVLFRASLAHRLGKEPWIRIVGEAGDASEGLRLAAETRPDVVLMDVDMPGLASFDAARQILAARPGCGIIYLSAHLRDHYVQGALDAGARGYLTKAESPEEVLHSIERVAAGGVSFSADVLDRIVVDGDCLQSAADDCTRLGQLTPREIEVLRYLARGMSKKEIAGTIRRSVKTVDNHCSKIMAKLAIHDRVEITRFAIREGLAEA